MRPKYTTNTEHIVYDGSVRMGVDKNIKFEESERSITFSEKSYDALYSAEEILDVTVNLNYSLTWHFYTLIATNIMFFFISYEIVFDPNIRDEIYVILIKIFCNVILLTDSLIALFYYHSKTAQYKVAYGKVDIGLVITQGASLLLFPLQLLKFFIFGESFIFNLLLTAVFTLRYYKLLVYIFLMHRIPCQMTATNLYKKNLVVIVAIIHSFACVWMAMGCFEGPEICDKKFNGTGTYWNVGPHYRMFQEGRYKKLDALTPFGTYIVCLFYATGGLTHVGYGGSSLRNDFEDLACICTMFFFVFVIYGLHTAELSTHVVHQKTLEFNMLRRRQAITEDLQSTKFINRKHRRRVITYYEEFWERDRAVKDSSMLDVIPTSLLVDTQTEIFWTFLNKCYFLRHTAASFRRAIASKIKIEVLNRPDVLYDTNEILDNVYYIARGNIEILSSEDGNSTIATLGKGTCLGQMNILQRTTTSFRVIVATYSVIYFLNKKDFWTEAYKFRKLHQTARIHENYKLTLMTARHTKENTKVDSGIVFRKWRCVVAKKILTNFKEKIKQSQQKWVTLGTSEHEDPHNLYTFSKLHNQRTYDAVFISTTFPWIFQQNSRLLTWWNWITTFTVIFVALYYPYQIAFRVAFETMSVHVVTAVYALDVFVQIFTAIDTKLDIITKVEDIILFRLENVKFFVDIISAIPVYLVGIAFNLNDVQKRIVAISNLNKLLKLYKVDDVFRKLEHSTQIDITALRSLRNIVYLGYLGYFIGCSYYIFSCFYVHVCDENSWISTLQRILYKNEDQIEMSAKHPCTTAFTHVLLILSGTTTPVYVNVTEMALVIFVALLGVFLVLSFFSGYTASLTLKNSDAVEYMEFLNTVKEYMTSARISKDLKYRVAKYLENLWMVNKAKIIKDLYHDCPLQLYNKNQILRFRGYLQQMDLFKLTSAELQNKVASRCTEIYLPPREYVIYAGQTCLNWYFIIHGYCGVLEGEVIQRMLPPSTTINALEIFCGLPSTVTIRTETHCKLLKYSIDDIQDMVKSYPSFVQQALDSIDQTAAARIFSRIANVQPVYKVEKVENTTTSCFTFPTKKRDPLNLDYKKQFYRKKCKFLRYVMMRKTILPNGRFYRHWVRFRAVSAVVVSLLAPTSFIHYVYFPHIQYALYVFYTFSFIDIYLKMHLCFYNDRGILVTHPRATAVNYVTHSFVLDAFSVMPFSGLVSFLANKRHTKLEVCLHFNVIFAMYRYANAFSKAGIYVRHSLFMAMLKRIPITLVILNTLTCILLCITGRETVVNGVLTMVRRNHTWVTLTSKLRHMDGRDPYTFFVISAYATTLTVSGVSFNLLKPTSMWGCAFVVSCVLIGYLVKVHNTVHVAHDRFNVAYKLTQHRNYMVQLSKYMKEEKLPKDLQHRIIEHYDHVWRTTCSVTLTHVLSLLHLPLKLDVVHFLYINTLRKVPVFEDANEAFYRQFGLLLTEMHTRMDTCVVRLNDIVDKIYIVHRGEALVKGPDGSAFAFLPEGSMFGNLDHVRATRSMVSVYTTSIANLLVVETEQLYNLFHKFEYVFYKLQHYLLLNNLSYIAAQRTYSSVTDEEPGISQNISKFQLFLMKLNSSFLMIILDVLTAVACCGLVSYQVAFETPFDFFYILYILDLFHNLCLIFFLLTPYYDKRGRLVVATRTILKTHLKTMKFFIDVATIPPYDVIGFAFKDSTEIRQYIGLYRLLRIMNVYHGFDRSSNAFGAKVVLFRLMKMLIYITLIVHLCACFWYYNACPRQKCERLTWIYDKGEFTCRTPYVCSIYLVMSVISTTGFKNRIPRDGPVDMALCCTLVILGQYLMGSIVGDTIALVRNTTMDLAQYNFEVAIFKTYLRNGIVSPPFLDRMKRYCISLWTVGNGRQVPTYLKKMPNDLLEELKSFAYGNHIYQNIFFENCHRDFLRLLIAKIKVAYFFVEDVICHQEDINDTMYFIHKGTVNVYTLTPGEEIHVDELKDTDSFGIIQGLYPNTPHTHTYKANTVCIILYLTYEDLAPLLTFYPASKFEIYSNLVLLVHEGTVENKTKEALVKKQIKPDQLLHSDISHSSV